MDKSHEPPEELVGLLDELRKRHDGHLPRPHRLQVARSVRDGAANPLVALVSLDALPIRQLTYLSDDRATLDGALDSLRKALTEREPFYFLHRKQVDRNGAQAVPQGTPRHHGGIINGDRTCDEQAPHGRQRDLDGG